jgi:20S proteasome alpha/beta subunit
VSHSRHRPLRTLKKMSGDTRLKYRYPLKKTTKMTCIIGGKCNDGVVLVADKKVIDSETHLFEFMEKLFIFQKDYFYYPIVVGSSGTIQLYDKFKEEAIRELEKINPNPTSFSFQSVTKDSINVSGTIYPYTSMSGSSKEVILDQYLKTLENIIKKYKRDYASKDFDVLFVAQVHQKGAVLFYFHTDGSSEDIYKHKVIGSGEIPANVFLKAINTNHMTMREVAKWGYFIIKHIEDYGIDNRVGVGRDQPQIYFIPNQGQLYEAENNFQDKCEQSKNKMEENLKNLLPR